MSELKCKQPDVGCGGEVPTLDKELGISEIQDKLGLSDRKYVREEYI